VGNATLDHIALMRRHLELGARHILRQREIIAELRAKGHETDLAERLLKTFEALQALRESDLQRHLAMRDEAGRSN